MFELRVQTDDAAREGATRGRPIGLFDDYPQAVAALDHNQTALDGQLTMNQEGASHITFSQVILDVSVEPEVGWLWSTYRPRDLGSSAAPVK